MNQQSDKNTEVVNFDEINNATQGTNMNSTRNSVEDIEVIDIDTNQLNSAEIVDINNNTQNSYKAVSNNEIVPTNEQRVLNYNEFEEVAMEEARSSKRPAILLAVAGIFSIVMGLVYPMVINFIDNSNNKTQDTEEISKIDKPSSLELNCSLSLSNSADGTDSSTSITYNFINSKLVRYTKSLNIIPTPGNSLGSTSVTNYYNLFKQFETSTIAGYTMTTTSADIGFNSTLVVDFSTFNKDTLTPEHVSTAFSNVNYEKNEEYKSVKEKATLAGYICDK